MYQRYGLTNKCQECNEYKILRTFKRNRNHKETTDIMLREHNEERRLWEFNTHYSLKARKAASNLNRNYIQMNIGKLKKKQKGFSRVNIDESNKRGSCGKPSFVTSLKGIQHTAKEKEYPECLTREVIFNSW